MNTLPGYQLEYRLGEGSAGTVWRARQSASLDRPVAVKRLKAAGGPAGAEQLRVEAEALACLDHPHIVRIFEILADGDGVAIAMQLAGGGSLDERLRRRGRMPPAEVADVAAKLAAALASAHRRGVLHRDVKPANVLFTTDGEPLLSDFGICSSAAAPDALIRGTEPYLDPTVRAGRPADATADVYALGAVAWEMLVCEPPGPP
ncbi:MAG TPA: serine/threonine-protein kinase, partial [Acidimicrobiales bacterium]|nr:serine/threonine-protein kinase [Acidimicrobiales bacterium]